MFIKSKFTQEKTFFKAETVKIGWNIEYMKASLYRGLRPKARNQETRNSNPILDIKPVWVTLLYSFSLGSRKKAITNHFWNLAKKIERTRQGSHQESTLMEDTLQNILYVWINHHQKQIKSSIPVKKSDHKQVGNFLKIDEYLKDGEVQKEWNGIHIK